MPETDATITVQLQTEWDRLVRRCACLTGARHIAEDLAQETRIRAWQNAQQLRDPQRRGAWLDAIARNVCRDWLRSHRPGMTLPLDDAGPSTIPDDFDLEVELEREELAELLDRALALLPDDTRAILIRRYVDELPPAEIARQLGLTDGAIAMRIQRGKLLLRTFLCQDLRPEAEAYGLVDADVDWRSTRIWCPICGKRHALGRFGPRRALWLDCEGCLGLPRSSMVRSGSAELFRGIQGFKPALNRLLDSCHAWAGAGILGKAANCPNCHQSGRIEMTDPWNGFHYVRTACPACPERGTWCSIGFIALARPAGQRFWRAHPRIHALPDRPIEVAGRAALVTGYASVPDNARYEVVFDRATLAVLAEQI